MTTEREQKEWLEGIFGDISESTKAFMTTTVAKSFHMLVLHTGEFPQMRKHAVIVQRTARRRLRESTVERLVREHESQGLHRYREEGK